MSRTDEPTPHDTDPTAQRSTYREYLLDVRIVERTTAAGETTYQFEAPHHEGVEFDEPDAATLYADVYFDANGFQEAGTGERGVPPEVIQAGRDTLVAYFYAQPRVDVNWLASYYGEKPEKIQRYVERVRKRATEIRRGAREQGMA